ncbi:MAG: hypothetical protein IJ559_03515 [Prevotella sp.]|nr:hypothetical protein [Prevotella sp.]
MDIANMVLYLCSDKAGYITGENICIAQLWGKTLPIYLYSTVVCNKNDHRLRR